MVLSKSRVKSSQVLCGSVVVKSDLWDCWLSASRVYHTDAAKTRLTDSQLETKDDRNRICDCELQNAQIVDATLTRVSARKTLIHGSFIEDGRIDHYDVIESEIWKSDLIQNPVIGPSLSDNNYQHVKNGIIRRSNLHSTTLLRRGDIEDTDIRNTTIMVSLSIIHSTITNSCLSNGSCTDGSKILGQQLNNIGGRVAVSSMEERHADEAKQSGSSRISRSASYSGSSSSSGISSVIKPATPTSGYFNNPRGSPAADIVAIWRMQGNDPRG
jgi:uncharacterized protein YjbI with pentapeptide repeats